MKQTHLTDTEIQEYVWQAESNSPAVREHVRHCESCLARAQGYNFLFSAVGEQPRPAFDSDLSELVMSRLKKPKASPVKQWLIVTCICLVSATFLAATFFLFGKPLLDLFSGRGPVVLYITLAIVAALTIFLVIESYREFRGKMKQLNFNWILKQKRPATV